MPSHYASAIYEGTVRHRRFLPKHHEFVYRVFMMYLDLQEIDSILSLSPFWSQKSWAIARFKRRDFHIDANNKNNISVPSIDESIRNTVEQEAGFRPQGPIRMLVNLRYWGYSINPICTYYCFDATNEKIVAIVAEVKNTPWNERHAYVLHGNDFSEKQQCHFNKVFHVSPFNPINMQYHWQSTTPSKTLAIHLENLKDDTRVMDATLTLRRREISAKNLNQILIYFPWMTVKVLMAIYWQALKLFLKGVPLFNHVKKNG